jgi:hypothetical protein
MYIVGDEHSALLLMYVRPADVGEELDSEVDAAVLTVIYTPIE